MWGGWLICTGIVLSFASGIIHPYYTVALAPGIAAAVALAVVDAVAGAGRRGGALGARRARRGRAWWRFELLGRAADWTPWLRWAVVLVGAAAAIVVLLPRMVAWLVAPLLAGTLLLAPTAYSLQTASTAHTGALPTAGPASTSGFGGPGGGGSAAGSGRRPAEPGGGRAAGGAPGGGFGGTRGSSAVASAAALPGGLGGATHGQHRADHRAERRVSYTWAAATVSANKPASLELATEPAVMSLGGFNGTDPAITLRAFKQLVAAGKIHYFVADGQGFIGSTAANTSTAYAIQQWVEANYTAQTIGGSTVYDLTAS